MLTGQIARMLTRHAARSKKEERRRVASLDGFGDIPRANETALMQVLSVSLLIVCAWVVLVPLFFKWSCSYRLICKEQRIKG